MRYGTACVEFGNEVRILRSCQEDLRVIHVYMKPAQLWVALDGATRLEKEYDQTGLLGLDTNNLNILSQSTSKVDQLSTDLKHTCLELWGGWIVSEPRQLVVTPKSFR